MQDQDASKSLLGQKRSFLNRLKNNKLGVIFSGVGLALLLIAAALMVVGIFFFPFGTIPTLIGIFIPGTSIAVGTIIIPAVCTFVGVACAAIGGITITRNNNIREGERKGDEHPDTGPAASKEKAPASVPVVPPATATAPAQPTPASTKALSEVATPPSSTPGGSPDLDLFSGKEVLEKAIQALQALQAGANDANANYLDSCQQANQAERKLKTGTGREEDLKKARETVELSRQILDSSNKTLTERYTHPKEEIARHYENLTKDPHAIDGIKKLTPQEMDVLVEVFEYLMTINFLTDGKVLRIANLFEHKVGSEKIFLAELADALHQGTEEQVKDYLNKVLNESGDINLSNIPDSLQYEPVPGDGNCMYSSVLYHLVDTPLSSYMTSQELRAAMAQYIRDQRKNNPEQYSDVHILRAGKQYHNMEDYLIALEYSRDFAEGYDVNILMDYLNRPIAIIGPDGKIRNVEDVLAKRNEHHDLLPPIFIYYNGVNHYSGLIIKGNLDASAILDGLLQPRPQLGVHN